MSQFFFAFGTRLLLIAIFVAWLGYGSEGAGRVAAFLVWFSLTVAVLSASFNDKQVVEAFHRPVRGAIIRAYGVVLWAFVLWALWLGHTATGGALFLWMVITSAQRSRADKIVAARESQAND